MCKADGARIGHKSTNIQRHFLSGQHEENLKKEKIQADAMAEHQTSLIKFFQKQQKEQDGKLPSGYSLPPDVQAERLRLLLCLIDMRASLSSVRALHEHYGHAIGGSDVSRQSLAQFIPIALDAERLKVQTALQLPACTNTATSSTISSSSSNSSKAWRRVAVSFDGTTDVAELLGVVVRFVDDEMQPVTRCIRLAMYAVSMNADGLAAAVLEALGSISINASDKKGRHAVASFVHDRASVNTCAFGKIAFIFPNAVDIPCFAHGMDNIGGRLSVPDTKTFVDNILSLLSSSKKFARLLREADDIPLRRINNTRLLGRTKENEKVARTTSAASLIA